VISKRICLNTIIKKSHQGDAIVKEAAKAANVTVLKTGSRVGKIVMKA